MKDRLNAVVRTVKVKLKTPYVQHLVLCSTGGAIIGSAATIYYSSQKYGWRPGDCVLVLPKEAFEALINDETNFVRFDLAKQEHVFRVSYEH